MESLALANGGLDALRERKHLEPVVREALGRIYPAGAEKDRKVRIPGWRRAGRVDAIVRHPPAAPDVRFLIELKWSGGGEDLLHEAVWDLFKMAIATTRDDVEGAFLLAGASADLWESGCCHDLYNVGVVTPQELCVRRFPTGGQRLIWDYSLEEGYDSYPDWVPARIQIVPVGHEDCRIPGETWELRMVQVIPTSLEPVSFEGGWPEARRPPDARRPA